MSETAVVANVLADLRGRCSGQEFYYPEQRDEIVNGAIAPLKDAPNEAAVAFVLTDLRIVCEEPGSWFAHALNHRGEGAAPPTCFRRGPAVGDHRFGFRAPPRIPLQRDSERCRIGGPDAAHRGGAACASSVHH